MLGLGFSLPPYSRLPSLPPTSSRRYPRSSFSPSSLSSLLRQQASIGSISSISLLSHGVAPSSECSDVCPYVIASSSWPSRGSPTSLPSPRARASARPPRRWPTSRRPTTPSTLLTFRPCPSRPLHCSSLPPEALQRHLDPRHRRDLERCHRSRSTVAGPYAGHPRRRLSGRGGLLPLGHAHPYAPSSPAPATSSPARLPCAPLPCAGISACADACHHAGHLLIARADTQQRQPFELFPSLVSTPLVRYACSPYPTRPAPSPSPLLLPLLVLSL